MFKRKVEPLIDDFFKIYRYIDKIDKGFYSTVYTVQHVISNDKYALKLLSESHYDSSCLNNNSKQDDIKYHWFKEYEIVQKLNHPNIIKIDQIFKVRWNNMIKNCLLLEYVPGKTLQKYILAHGPIVNLDEFNKIIKQLLSALNYIFNQGIVHRDIKSENIMYHDGLIKLIDFGLANYYRTPPSSEYKPIDLSKKAGTVLYMAPELIFSLIFDLQQLPKCDIWSLGVVSYYIISGKLPFVAPTLLEFKNVIMTGIYTPIENIDKSIEYLISKCLVINAVDRFDIDQLLMIYMQKNQ